MQKPTIGKRTYTDLEEANKRIKELEIENMTLRLKSKSSKTTKL